MQALALSMTGGNGRDGNGGLRAIAVLTGFIKLGGLVIAINEALVIGTLRPGAIGLAAFMMAGAQSVDTILATIFNPPKR